MIIRISEQINSLKFRRKIFYEMYLQNLIPQDTMYNVLEGLDASIKALEILFKDTKQNEYTLKHEVNPKCQ